MCVMPLQLPYVQLNCFTQVILSYVPAAHVVTIITHTPFFISSIQHFCSLPYLRILTSASSVAASFRLAALALPGLVVFQTFAFHETS